MYHRLCKLGYEPYQRDPQLHTNSRNGCYERDLDTQFGAIRGLRVPRPREGKTQYRVLERYRRRAPWVDRLAQEMFLAGVSTRRVGPIMESLLEASLSASTVSRVATGLQQQLQAWPRRPLCLAKDIDALLAFFRQPAAHWRKIRTTNAIERQFREVRRRTDPMTCFANEDSADRILFAVFTHANQRWAKSPLKEFTQKY